MRQRLVLIGLGCSLLALMSAEETYVWYQVAGHPISFLLAFLLRGTPWLAWAAFAPAVDDWRTRFKLGWPLSPSSLLAHLGGALAAIALFSLVSSIVDHWFGVRMPHDPFWLHFRRSYLYESALATITYGATLGVGYAADYRRRSRELAQLQAELARAQLSALRMQLNPHFLFNALHTIAAFVREHDERQAVDLIERLGDVLRHVLQTSTEVEVSLGEELAFLKKYLEIEQARFGDRLRVSWAAQDDSKTALVPQLILQPLVENALRHGLGPRAAPGHLSIAASRRANTLELTVCDDGVGLRTMPGSAPHPGVGLANVRARLTQMYGRDGHLSLQTAPSGGVLATVTLPFRQHRQPPRAAHG